MSFANNLKAIMQEQKLSQTDLSKLTGIGKPSLSQYLSGRHLPYQNRVIEIADALGVPSWRLTTKNPDAEYEPPPPPSHQKVTIAEAARRLGKSKQFVRVALQNGIAPFGFATKGSGSAYDYHISPKLLNDYIGEN